MGSATVKSFNPVNKYGFINFEGMDGGLFFHAKSCIGSFPQAGDTVKFDIEPNPSKPGSNQAVNITGGSQPLNFSGKGAKGKGKGGPYGGDMGGMMAMMMAMMMGGMG